VANRPTLCCACVNLVIVNKSDAWYRWQCFANRSEARPNYVTGGVEEPYKLCRYVNNGDCPDYTEGVNSLHPKGTTDDQP
jgi:hypothetical protein